ncbi:MAG: FtsX-like permease family protein [Bacteroidales bacterium]|nr:FtsX-like permease family protein [Bacteroidales bacterium]
MNFEFFIASRIFLKSKANFSKPIVRLGVISVALGLSVMIISVAIVTGFQQQIRDKVIGFGSHIQISNFEVNSSYEETPISINQSFYPFLDTVDGIRHIQVYANKAGIIKTDDQIEGVILKGVGRDYDWSFFERKIVEGKHFTVEDSVITNNVIISKILASRLKLKVEDNLFMYFIIKDEMQPRGRKFLISGIYETGLEEFDKLYVLSDIQHLQKLNKWESDKVGGFEVLIEDFDRIDEMGEIVYSLIGYNLNSKTIKEKEPQIFEWLDLQDMNVIIIIALMVIVAGITMISTLLILILEKTNMIGTLKAMGTQNKSIRKIFVYNAIYIIGKGLIYGNIIAIGLCFLQIKTGIFKLNQESYYVSHIPVNLQLSHLLIINAGTLLICTLMLIIPTYIITRISPVKAMRFS